MDLICFLCLSPTKCTTMEAKTRLAQHAERTEVIENINIFSEKIEGRDQFDDLRADTKRILKETLDLDWIHVAQNMFQWRAFVYTVMEVPFSRPAD